MPKFSDKEKARRNQKRKEKRRKNAIVKSKIEYYQEKIQKEEEKKTEKIKVEWPLPNRPVVEAGEIRNRMAKAVSNHTAEHGKGNRPELLKKILIPSNHLTEDEKKSEIAWKKKVDFICRQGKVHLYSKEEYEKYFDKSKFD